MIQEHTIRKFKKLNPGDIMGVVRTLFPDVEVETILSNNKRKKS